MKGNYLRIILVLLLLVSLYQFGVPIEGIVAMGVLFIAVILLRGPLYKKIETAIISKFPAFGKLHPWIQKGVIILCFIIIYAIFKQIIFLGLKLIGFDLQKMIFDSIERKMV